MANLARQVAIFGIIAVGQLLVILTAGIDLSVGSVLGLAGCVTAGCSSGLAIPVAISTASPSASLGLFNGRWSPTGTAAVRRYAGHVGIAAARSGLSPTRPSPLPDAFGNIANGDFLGFPNLLWMFLIRRRRHRVRAAPDRVRRYIYAIG